VSGQDQPAPGVVHVRLSGLPADADALAAVLASVPAVQILSGPDGPYPSRRQPGTGSTSPCGSPPQPPPKPEASR
jgi:hypothetical protein